MLHTGYDPSLVVLSITIAVLASYTALDLGGRVAGSAPAARLGWVAAASLAMGGGIWSMHFVGMLAFQMAMPVMYDPLLTALSLLIAVGVTGAAFGWVTRRRARPTDVLIGGPLMGIGVAAMHYTGMAAMRVPGDLAFSPAVVSASVLIAVTAATAALWLATRQNDVWQKAMAAIVMGLAVAGMHYTGMAAATFTMVMQGAPEPHSAGLALGQQNLALYVTGATFVILFLGMFAAAFDQQRGGRQLHASEERFRAAAEAVGDIIWTTDAKGVMQGHQPYWQRFTGQAEAECQNYGWTAAIHPDDIGPTLEAWERSVAAREMFIFEHRVRRQDGEYRACAIRAVPVLNRDASVREWVGVHEDVTQRREAERALRDARQAAEEANRAKSEFLANMSHELRTPLSAIIGYAEMLQEEMADGAEPAELVSDMGKVEGNARHLLGLINDVLDLSKIESGKMEVFAEDFALEPMLTDVATTVGSLVARKSNTLTLDLEPGLGMAHTDLVKLRQVLLNLLSNASKFTEGGTITLAAARERDALGRDMLRFAVRDNGIGLSSDQMARLFQRFTQADSSTTRKFGGTGLGLSLVKAFATMLGGDVAVSSTVGEGSTFAVTIPATYVASDACDPSPEAPAKLEEASGAGHDLVLVIDDDPDQRTLMARFLHREGFRVQVAADGPTGLAAARQIKPCAILLDVMMPGVDGWSVLTEIKADPDLARVPVVMVTSLDQRSLAASLGAADYMLKPVRWDRFSTVMDRFRTPPEGQDQQGCVLLVDDDVNARLMIRSVLERDGWSVAEAGNGAEGLAEARRRRPEAVLLDLTMPVMDGFDFMDALRTVPGCAEVPVVVLTARDLNRDDRRRLRGASQVLNKGDLSMAALVQRLHTLADRQPKPAEPVT